jgi:hypothetical protein
LSTAAVPGRIECSGGARGVLAARARHLGRQLAVVGAADDHDVVAVLGQPAHQCDPVVQRPALGEVRGSRRHRDELADGPDAPLGEECFGGAERGPREKHLERASSGVTSRSRAASK